MTCTELAFKIMNDYDSNMYTQEQLSSKYGIPIEIISKLTKQCRYSHGKRDLKTNCLFEYDVDYLKPYLPKE